MFNAWTHLRLEESRRMAQAENTGRLAFAYGQASTTGWGELEIPSCIDFELTFIEMPYVAYGFAVDGESLVDTRFPRCSGGVSRWRQDTNGYYVGAWVFVTVETQSPYIATTEVEPGYPIDHFFSFSGIALKNVSPYLLDDL